MERPRLRALGHGRYYLPDGEGLELSMQERAGSADSVPAHAERQVVLFIVHRDKAGVPPDVTHGPGIFVERAGLLAALAGGLASPQANAAALTGAGLITELVPLGAPLLDALGASLPELAIRAFGARVVERAADPEFCQRL
jgi:hypothetical protein